MRKMVMQGENNENVKGDGSIYCVLSDRPQLEKINAEHKAE